MDAELLKYVVEMCLDCALANREVFGHFGIAESAGEDADFDAIKGGETDSHVRSLGTITAIA